MWEDAAVSPRIPMCGARSLAWVKGYAKRQHIECEKARGHLDDPKDNGKHFADVDGQTFEWVVGDATDDRPVKKRSR